MGCDIHICLEVRKDGKWEPLVRMIPNRWYDEERYKKAIAEGKEPWEKPEIVDTLFEGRNYDLFAMLADVRNGRGFAGCDTGNGFLPIAFPRGIPEDAAPATKDFLNSYGVDGHSHSWHTLADFDAYNWDMTTKHRGVVSIVEYASFKRDGQPTSWCGGVGGGGTRMLSIEEMEALYQKHKALVDKCLLDSEDRTAMIGMLNISEFPAEIGNIYTRVQWEESYRESAETFVTKSIPRMRQLAQEEGVGPSDIRMLFFFDN